MTRPDAYTPELERDLIARGVGAEARARLRAKLGGVETPLTPRCYVTAEERAADEAAAREKMHAAARRYVARQHGEEATAGPARRDRGATGRPGGTAGRSRAVGDPVGASEEEHQRALFDWARAEELARPALALLFAIPNGGHRRKATAGRLKAAGVKRGVPDLCLPVPCGAHHGLWIELKRETGGRAGPAQQRWHEDLTALGYRVAVCHGWLAARDVILDYLNADPA